MAKAKPHVIINPAAAQGRAGRLWPDLQQALNAVLPRGWGYSMTERPWQAPELTRAALKAGATMIILVGGDGTLNEVVNGFFENERPIRRDIVLGLIPMGTGGDFRKTFKIGTSWQDAVRRLQHGRAHPVDLGKLTCVDAHGQQVTRYYANIASFGASGLVDAMVNRTSKVLGGKISFLVGTMRGLRAYQNQLVRLTIDDQPVREVIINTVAVAIGQCFGGGMRVAAEAKPDDGLFDIVVIGDIGLARFLRESVHLYQGTHLNRPDITLSRGTRVRAESQSQVLLDMDGETPGQLPATFEILPKAYSLWY